MPRGRAAKPRQGAGPGHQKNKGIRHVAELWRRRPTGKRDSGNGKNEWRAVQPQRRGHHPHGPPRGTPRSPVVLRTSNLAFCGFNGSPVPVLSMTGLCSRPAPGHALQLPFVFAFPNLFCTCRDNLPPAHIHPFHAASSRLGRLRAYATRPLCAPEHRAPSSNPVGRAAAAKNSPHGPKFGPRPDLDLTIESPTMGLTTHTVPPGQDAVKPKHPPGRPAWGPGAVRPCRAAD